MPRPEPPVDEASPKYVHLADQLAARLRAGEWSIGKLPTVRDIADTYDVSSFTASRALQLLRDRGLVVTRDRSGSYAAERGADPVVRWAVVMRVSPGPWQSASEAVVRVGFERVAGQGAFALRPLAVPPTAGAAEVDRAVAAVAKGGTTGVFFLPSRVSEGDCRQDEWFLAGCRKRGLPVVLLDRNLRGERRGLECDLVASDHADGGRRCTEHLLALGRKRIACVVASPTSTHTDRLAGYLSALENAGPGRPPLVLRVPERLEAREAYPWAADELVRAGADGAICYQDYVAVGVILELFRRGLNVPRDVAVVGCDDLPIGQSFALGVSSYTYPSEEIVRTALRVMENRIAYPGDPFAKVLLPGRLVVRDSSVVG
ncbi:putative HTH-type transcriptional repressor ExuR [Gemmata obscuriglobus]|uniref:GntR family transcriptional regulator n=1 Tax=Gemmata obscuriglobus TaxID=114 RepID=A0A2Z3GZT4_9BACT|nr:GntR family transcriptional regulator [Gemmata obscuriglobus]AWM40029.1 GntR family transcriptional regulator [Gemmata obscuriglobus]QEG26814.1 putative HTH-type transcriptional repressor ExuR [Gemmata obscuriglobus]VTS02732.1 family transcriptional regulator : Transcriptional regulators-like protein OS=Pirellula staleyi (strain ATCC 27377 / DSM 6068 / ICPB 4128) GN=Psta_4678 PE=4 SV=1: GntR: Peripla_BP_3 [Gemmata obscuriglobus UQM 2246]